MAIFLRTLESSSWWKAEGLMIMRFVMVATAFWCSEYFEFAVFRVSQISSFHSFLQFSPFLATEDYCYSEPYAGV